MYLSRYSVRTIAAALFKSSSVTKRIFQRTLNAKVNNFKGSNVISCLLYHKKTSQFPLASKTLKKLIPAIIFLRPTPLHNGKKVFSAIFSFTRLFLRYARKRSLGKRVLFKKKNDRNFDFIREEHHFTEDLKQIVEYSCSN